MGNFTGIGKLPSELTEKTNLTEGDIVITGSGAGRTTWKNIFEKISFSGLLTTAKNIVGAINELNTKLNVGEINIASSYKLYKEGRKITANCYQFPSVENLSIPTEYRPNFTIYVPCIYYDESWKYYPGYLMINNNGTVFVKYYSSVGIGGSTDATTGFVNFNATWYTK